MAHKDYHITLASYFQSKTLYLDGASTDNLNMRKIVELPWQLSMAGMFMELKAVLTDYEFFLSLSNINRYEIWKHWEAIPTEIREVVESYKTAISNWKKQLGQSKEFELAINELEHYFLVSGEKYESGNLAIMAYELALNLYPEDHIIVAIRRNNLATAYYHLGRFSEAESLLRKALPVYLNEFGESKEDYWIIHINLGMFRFRLGDFVEAERLLRESISGTKLNLGRLHTTSLTAVKNLAEIVWYNGKFQEAKKFYEEAIEGRTTKLGINNPMTIEIQSDYKFLISDFINVPHKEATNNLINLLQKKGLPDHAEKLKKSHKY